MSSQTDQQESKSDAPSGLTAKGMPDANSTPDPAATTKPCPYCNKTLDSQAVTCRYCRRDLYAENAAKIVLTEEDWDTSVPEWMIEAEEKMLQRRKLLKKLRKQSWRIVAAIIMGGVCVIIWRICTAPPEPHQQLLAVRNNPAVTRPMPQPTAKPEPTVPSLTQSAVASAFGGDINPRGGNRIDERNETVSSPVRSTASPEPTPPPSFAEPDTASFVANRGADESARAVEIRVTAEDLAAEFEERTFADDKYVGQEVAVSGELKLIDTTTKVPYVVFHTGNHPPIKCLLKPQAKKQLYRVKPGRSVVVRGKCDGAFIDIVLSDCEFVF